MLDASLGSLPGMAGLLAGLLLLIVLTMRGFNLFILAPLCALLVAVTNGVPFWQTTGGADFIHGYMNGFASFVSAWFLMFLLGSLFGKLMEHTGAADAVALHQVERIADNLQSDSPAIIPVKKPIRGFPLGDFPLPTWSRSR